VLQHGVAEVREWHAPELPPVHLFCDARGQPPHLAAVLFCDGRCLCTHLKPTPEMLQRFRSRRDNQIMGLELLSISLGLSTFQDQLRGRKVVIHSDNSGSEVGFLPRVPCQRFAVRCVLGRCHCAGERRGAGTTRSWFTSSGSTPWSTTCICTSDGCLRMTT
jgi:hypothetical protein